MTGRKGPPAGLKVVELAHVMAGPVCGLMLPDLADDPRFTDSAGRMGHLRELETILSGIFRTRPGAQWLERLEAAGVPAGPVLSVRDMQEDPQAVARAMVVAPEHSRLGPVKAIGLPLKFSETPGAVAVGAPVYGEHRRAVLAEHGCDEAEIEALIAEGAVVAA